MVSDVCELHIESAVAFVAYATGIIAAQVDLPIARLYQGVCEYADS